MNDRGIWAAWYDLPDKGREQHLEWLHGTYIPKIMKKPGVLWGAHFANAGVAPGAHLRQTQDKAVPTGNSYILIFGAETPHAFTRGWQHFAKHAPNRMEEDLTSADREMLSMRAAARYNIFTEEARANGPEAALRGPGLTPGPVVQFGTFNAPDEEQIMSWYGDWRIGALSKLPGCVGIRKLLSVAGWAKHGVLYEFASLEQRAENMPKLSKLYPEERKWSDGFTPTLVHAPGSPVVGTRLWPPVQKQESRT